MNYESEFIFPSSAGLRAQVRQFWRSMINLSSFIAFHARRTPDRCSLKYRGQEISYAAVDQRIPMIGGWLASRRIGPHDAVPLPRKNRPAVVDIAFAAKHSSV